MMYFNDVNNLNELKSRFRQWAFKLHPDKGGNEKEFSAMQQEYEARYRQLKRNEEEGIQSKQDKSFGLIEFKYQGKSLDKNKNKNKDDNSLAEHCNDFRIMLSDEYREKIVNKLIKHTKLLIELDIIKDAKVKKIIDDININNLWCGFYFVEDKERSTKRNNKFMNLGDRIVFDCYNQIICNKEFDKQFLQDIKFQNSDTCDVVFNMTEKMYYSCKK